MRSAFLPSALLLLLLLLLVGCASPTHGEKMVQSYQRTRETVAESDGQVDQVLVSLLGLRKTPMDGLPAAFRRYKEAVDGLVKESDAAAFRAKSMQEEADEHVRAWQEEMASLKTESVKASLQARRDAVKSNFAIVKLYADDVKKAYGPCVAGNKDIVKALSIDLSPAAVEHLSPAIDDVVAGSATLKQKLAAMEHALDNIAAGLSPLGAEIK
jgi:hypothetical protein